VHSAEILWQLKRLYPEDADLNKIERRGKQVEGDTNNLSDDEDSNTFSKFMPLEFLKKLPGIDSAKVQMVLKEGKNHGIRTIVDICHSDVETLAKVVGIKSAREVKSFLD